MKTTVIALSLVAALLAAGPTEAQDLRYWGASQDPATGLIELGGQMFSVRAGDTIPNWGVVEAVSAEELVVKRVLTDDQKAALRTEGKAVYDAQHLRLRNVRRMLPQDRATP